MLRGTGDAATVERGSLTFRELSKLSDEDLMAYLRAGDGDALAVIFDRYHRLVYSIAFKALRNAAEAQDVSQTIFMEVFRDAVRFDASRGTLKGWLLQYSYHRSLNRLRYLNVRSLETAEDFAEAGERSAEESFRINTISWNLPERALLVRQALGVLTESQRRTLELAFFEGLSIKEICNRMRTSEGNVRHYYYRGLERLRNHLEGKAVERSTVIAVREAANV